MNVGIVMPVGPGRSENVREAMRAIDKLGKISTVLVGDGVAAADIVAALPLDSSLDSDCVAVLPLEKHEPGMEQPRNVGARYLRAWKPDMTHAWFVDSDVVLEPWALDEMVDALDEAPEDRILVGPYDWLGEGWRPEIPTGPWADRRDLHNDPRWAMFNSYDSSHVFHGDLSAGLGCFSGNLLWPLDEFERVGGFWSEIHHGRCEDGELGLRAVAMDVGISMVREARGFHLWHPVNTPLAIERNERDVPMLNARHPWVQGADIFMVDRDGKAFDVLCPHCALRIPTIDWWSHAAEFGVSPRIAVK